MISCFYPCADRSEVKSIYSPSTRFTQVVEDGFRGPVIPADFAMTPQGLEVVRGNIEKAGIVGRQIANNYSAAMITTQLMEFDPRSGELGYYCFRRSA